MGNAPVSKAEWRAFARDRRSVVDLEAASRRIVDHIERWQGLAGTVCTYLAMDDEIDLSRLVAVRPDCRWVVTRTPERGELTIHDLGSPMEVHRLGFHQPDGTSALISPSEVDVFLVPGLAFDVCGVRLGRGAGHFDRLLATVEPGASVVGISPAAATFARLPTADHDIPMSHLGTEYGVTGTARDLPDAARRFLAAAIGEGLAVTPQVFPDGTKTSADAAEAVGAELGAIAKSLVFMADDRPVVVLISGDRRVDTGMLATAMRASGTRRASLEEARSHTGYAAGGTPAVGLAEPVPVLADISLQRYSVVWSAAGTPTAVYPVELDRLVSASDARWVDVAET